LGDSLASFGRATTEKHMKELLPRLGALGSFLALTFLVVSFGMIYGRRAGWV
jgi:hypothetical protein